MGKSVLERLNGVKKVTRGWQGFMEINAVTYDDSVITVEQMEEELKKARTYRKTIRTK